MTLEGIDASYYQGYIDWHQVKTEGGKRFAFVKATEGTAYNDPTFPHNWQGTFNNGIVRAAYHFLHMNVSAVSQADNFCRYVKENGGFHASDLIMLDVEVTDSEDAAAIENAISAFIAYCKSLVHRNVVIYTSPDFWIHTLGNVTDKLITSCPLCIADWGVTPDKIPTLAPWPSGAAFWQYSDNGHCPGVQGAIDLDRFFGDGKALTRLAVPS